MPHRPLLIMSLLIILLSGTGCGLFRAEEPAERISPAAPAKTEDLLRLHQELTVQKASLLVQRARIMENYGAFDAPTRLGRLDRAHQKLRQRQTDVRTRLQQRGLFPNNLRYAVSTPETLNAKATPELSISTAPKPTEPKQIAVPNPKPLPRKALASTPDVPAPASSFAGVNWKQDTQSFSVFIATSDPLPRFKTFSLTNPPRIVVDTPVTKRPTPAALRLVPSSTQAKSIRMGWHPEQSFVRVVIDCKGPVPRHSVMTTPRGITVNLPR
ncbi:AMIN domain-containing protein [Desulfovibrio ferrophilus]|uniref:N-acetylmuramoyl-L-alanine amidase n=1 Tax=Desulfovibrio ferrophilus TaxID=241368 RepID=A0A2Z6AUK8_9BACT|nr:AMIN domain-containing protein [Desulfovibrio ferrophilus]BBD06922.1 N-acetylmuramoyl-L-alanine amidase [Desulfovibrio ferrophilus]